MGWSTRFQNNDPSYLEPRISNNETQLAQIVSQQVFLTKQGLRGDGVFRTIASVFPSVTLSQVQSLKSSATLNNSADWYVLQNLVNTSADYTEIVVDGSFVLDLPIVISRNNITFRGKSYRYEQWVITQNGVNQDAFTISTNTNTHHITFKDLFILGSLNSDGTKSGHGIEITTSVSDGQLSQLLIDHCLIHNMGGSGVIKTNGHFVSSTIKDSDIGYCYDNGIYFVHMNAAQCNEILISNVQNIYNGFVYSGGQFIQSPTYLTDRGHGLSVSGMGITIIGGEGSVNAGAGEHINIGSVNGIVVTGRYHEANKLSDIYVTTGYKQGLNVGGNYVSSTSAQYGTIYYEDASLSISENENTEIPVKKYTHTSNISVTVSNVDVATGTFTSNGHGLNNGDNLFITLNTNALNVYPISVYPAGVSEGNSGYYVVNATANTFQLSSTSGGSPITLSTNATMDLTKWHFEKFASEPNINGLPSMQKCKMIIKGKSLQYAPQCYLPSPLGENGNNLANFSNTFTYNELDALGSVYSDVEITFDYTTYLTTKVKGIVARGSNATQNSVSMIDKIFVSTTQSNGQITAITLDGWHLANGTTIEIYKIR